MAKTVDEIVAGFKTLGEKADQLERLDLEVKDLLLELDKDVLEGFKSFAGEDRVRLQQAALAFVTDTFRRAAAKLLKDPAPTTQPVSALGGFPELT